MGEKGENRDNMWDNLFGSVDLLKKGMDTSWLRDEVISNNLANADTTGFKTSQVKFEDAFADALEGKGVALNTTDARHIAVGASKVESVSPQVVTDSDTSLRYDGNNVDAEHEMAEMAKNTIEYYALVSKMNGEFKKLDTAINIT